MAGIITDQDSILDQMKEAFDLTALSEISTEDFIAFGMMNSHLYRAKLLKLMKESKLDTTECLWVVILATAIKSKKRILNAMTRFSDKDWYTKVHAFYQTKIVEKTPEIKEGTFAVVHIPSSLPGLSAIAWKHMTDKSNRTVETMIQNLWFGQLHLDEDLQTEHMEWEKEFWNSIPENKRKEKDYDPSYYDNKKTDKYLVFDSKFNALQGPYTRDTLKKWLKK